MYCGTASRGILLCSAENENGKSSEDMKRDPACKGGRRAFCRNSCRFNGDIGLHNWKNIARWERGEVKKSHGTQLCSSFAAVPEFITRILKTAEP